jgi:hypothetical protein
LIVGNYLRSICIRVDRNERSKPIGDIISERDIKVFTEGRFYARLSYQIS